MPPDAASLDSLLWAVRFHLYRRYGSHPWWEDLHAEGRLAAYLAVTRVEHPTAALSTIACRAAFWAVQNWLRTRQNPDRTYARTGAPLKWVKSLVAVEDLAAEESDGGDLVENLWLKLEAERLRGWLASDPGINALQRALVERITMGGEKPRVVARELGITEWNSWDLRRRAVARLRERQEEYETCMKGTGATGDHGSGSSG